MNVFSKKNIKIIMLLILFTMVVAAAFANFSTVLTAIAWIFGLILPFILGGSIAFILNIPMTLIEKHILSKFMFRKKSFSIVRRAVSLVLAIIILLTVFVIVMFLIIPELGNTLKTLGYNLPRFFNWAETQIYSLTNNNTDIINLIGSINFDWNEIIQRFVDFFQKGALSILTSTFSMASSIIGGIFTFFVALFFSIYILVQKEKLGVQLRKLLYAYIKEPYVDKFFSIMNLTSQCFSKFISGTCTEIVIIVVLFYVSMSIFQFPYALMISVMIGLFAFIPIFGTIIGCILGALLILVTNPIQALLFVVLFIVVQQIEGNLIYPHVVGNSVGLPSIWVLVAVSVGGSALGILGMIISIPIVSVIYILLKEAVNKNLEQKQIPKEKLELSDSPSFYEKEVSREESNS